MSWSRALLLIAITIGPLGPSACHKDDKDPCLKLIEQQVKCDFKGGAALDAPAQEALAETCREQQKTITIRAALDCLKAKDCRSFSTCRNGAEELKGLKGGY